MPLVECACENASLTRLCISKIS